MSDKPRNSYTAEERQQEDGRPEVPPGAYIPKGSGDAPVPPEVGGPRRAGLDKTADDKA
jgi:hypothetical protein